MDSLLELLIDIYDEITNKNKEIILEDFIRQIKQVSNINSDKYQKQMSLLNDSEIYKKDIKDLLLNMFKTFEYVLIPLHIQFDIEYADKFNYNKHFKSLINIILPVYQLLSLNIMSSSLTLPVKEMFNKIDEYLSFEKKDILKVHIDILYNIFNQQGWNGEDFNFEPNKKILMDRLSFIFHF